MKRVEIDPTQPDFPEIQKAQMVLKEGGLVVYPTDTLYGLGANIFQEEAVKRVYHVKKRSPEKPLSICISRVQDLQRVAHMDLKSFQLANKLLPGPYTLVVKKNPQIPYLITAGSDKVGIRIPDHPICRVLSMEFPITTTSANISGEEAPLEVDELVNLFQDQVDLYLDAGDAQPFHSTVIDLTTSPPTILREGAGMDLLNQLLDDLF
ncbi:MAG: L-threonylcarbamoyladenylate synthase [Euryarchaeota archaeon]|jgi:L-threonylcarbamoyladenylate synthase|nr:L-threonylcarbamoyladenylate synthase [Euryarchaeota archaeon]HNS25176.1 L-threonylcarbamoyladenylate synthase [Methanobacteriaceae archaeon]